PVTYTRDARHAGETKYTLRRMMKFALDAISSFSWLPLQAATLLGFVFSIVAFLGLPLVIVARIAGIYVPGVSTILFVILLLGGIQLITVGIIGEYVGRIYDEVKGRPLYVVREDRHIAELYRELGMEDEIEWRESSVGIYSGGRTYPFTTPLDLLRFRPLSIRARLRMGLVTLLIQRRYRAAEPFEHVSARDWVTR